MQERTPYQGPSQGRRSARENLWRWRGVGDATQLVGTARRAIHVSQIVIFPEVPPAAIVRPSGEKATVQRAPRPVVLTSTTGSNVSAFHSLIVPSASHDH